ncbi:thiol-disulfide oxidoreductase DCC family protein [Glaciecola sp. 1036]|uniref:thiol-disulfide oxidoreductase DCC family protein n=1 Tax=Alteromonadaceae TaxID=72275 RepID=UPI003CFDD18B
MAFTLFYDGSCPLCMKEVRALKKRDTKGDIQFEDITEDDFSVRYPHLSVQDLDARIHGMEEDGRLLFGLDVAHRAWGIVGFGWLYAPLRWPVIRWFADKGYLLFARHRHKISAWLMGKPECEDKCRINSK